MIVIEGPDASGKSTLALELSHKLGYPIVPSEGPEKEPGEILDRIRRYNALPQDNLIFDRHPVISQSIYSNFNQSTKISEELLQAFKDKNPLIIYASPKNKGLHTIKEHDTLLHVEMVTQNAPKIAEAYDAFMTRHFAPHYIIYHFEHKQSVVDYVLRWCRLHHNNPPADFMADIHDFHHKFGLTPSPVPSLLHPDLMSFREKFLQEELAETLQAYQEGNLEKTFDGLIDLVYVALGTAYLMGLPFNRGWSEVHRANMRKVRAEKPGDSKRNSSFDVIKPEGWLPPDLSKLLNPAEA